MGALAGIWSPKECDVTFEIKNMVGQLALFEHDKKGCFQKQPMALGYVHQGSRNLSEYVWNDDRIFLTFIGDIRNSVDLKRSTNSSTDESMAKMLASLYYKFEEQMALKINGVFALWIYDKQKKCAMLINDRFGQTRIYYTKVGNTILFASKAKALLSNHSVAAGVNKSMLLDLLLYRSPMNNESLFDSIHLLPPATIWRFSETDTVQSIYWRLEDRLCSPSRDKKRDQLEQTRLLFNQAVSRTLDADVMFNFGLTSGLDSRCILSAIEPSSKNISCFTRGSEKNPDVIIAEKLANAYNLPFERKHVAKVSADEFRVNLEKAIFMTEGLGNMESAVYLDSVIESRESSRTTRQLTGTLGNQIMRIPLFFANKPAPFAVMEDSLFGKIPVRHKPLTWLFDNAFKNIVHLYIGISDASEFFNPEYLALAKERFHEMNQRVYSAADRIGFTSLGGKLHYLALKSLVQNCFPARNPMCEIYYRSPFIDIDFFEYMAKVPLAMKSELKMVFHRYIIENNNPELASFPFYSKAKLGYFNKAAQQKWRGVMEHEIPRTILFELGHRMRSDLKDFTRDVLLKNDLFCDQFLNKQYIRMMVKNHFDGRINATYAISNLIVFELWHQQFSGYLNGNYRPVEFAAMSNMVIHTY